MQNTMEKRTSDSVIMNQLLTALNKAVREDGPATCGYRGEMESRLLQFQKMASLGQVALGLAHEFNNLLGIISGYADLLLSEQEEEGASTELDEIRKAAERAGALSQQILSFGRKSATASNPVDLNHVVQGISRLLLCLVGKTIPLHFELSAQPCPILALGGEIEQILLNLILNARDAVSLGGAIFVETALVHLPNPKPHYWGVLPPGKYVQLSVRDTGCGMDERVLAHLCEPLFTTKPAGKGTGLGMSIIADLLKQQGGCITVWSQPGVGTHFELYWTPCSS